MRTTDQGRHHDERPGRGRRPTHRGRPRSRVLGALAWLVAAPLAAAALLALLGGRTWPGGVLSSFAPQLAVLAIGGLLVIAVLRRWLALFALFVGLAALAWMLRLPRAASVSGPPAPGGATIRVLQFNAYALNRTPAEAFDVVMASDADIVSIIDPPGGLVARLRSSAERAARWPYGEIPPNASTGWTMLLSRWPQSPVPEAIVGADVVSHRGGRVQMVRTPAGPVAVVQLHPLSPRTAASAAAGDAALDRAIGAIAGGLALLDVPILVACDLNGTPTSDRGRRLALGADLRAGKPRWLIDGTWPADRHALLRIAIDDVYLSRDLRLRSWRTLDGGGSDHRAVEAEIDVPRARIGGG